MNGLILGVGNPHRGDDGAGLEVARRLMSKPLEGWDVRLSAGDLTELMAAWERYRRVVVVDAVVTGSAPVGTVHHWDGGVGPLPTEWQACSSHSLGLAEAIELARAFGKLPESLNIIGVEAGMFCFSETLSRPVEDAVAEVVRFIMDSKELTHA